MYDKKRLKDIYTDIELKRIELSKSGCGANVDVHGLSENEARILVNSVLIYCGDLWYIRVIHGYRKGRVLQKMIRKVFEKYPMVEEMNVPSNNPGETVFILKRKVA